MTTLQQPLDELYSTIGPDEATCLTQSRQRTWQALQTALSPVVYAYDFIEWPLTGGIWFVVGPHGLVGVHFGGLAEEGLLQHYRQRAGRAAHNPRTGLTLTQDHSITDPVKAQLLEYLHGQRQAFDLTIDWSMMPSFQAQVLRHALQIPRGQVVSYGGLARQLGKPKSARAVGRALGSNPMPIIIPCHRIVGASGQLTGYIGGLPMKAYLLQLEGYAA
jgi:O-6-methylguanine DNA methyltransferase